MFHVILYQPEIPPNTGNVIRMCANTGARLHLIAPLRFDIDEKAVRRAGMDYAELADVKVWQSLDECLQALGKPRWFAVSTRSATRYDSVQFAAGDAFVFGPETRGLPQQVLEECPPERRLRIPMRAAVVVYEAWRQRGFA
jgi:tRNA (cytidine/uridine-2'-O-)-methyltransferase